MVWKHRYVELLQNTWAFDFGIQVRLGNWTFPSVQLSGLYELGGLVVLGVVIVLFTVKVIVDGIDVQLV